MCGPGISIFKMIDFKQFLNRISLRMAKNIMQITNIFFSISSKTMFPSSKLDIIVKSLQFDRFL